MEDRAMSHRKETEAMAGPQPIEDWALIPWRKLERKVFRLQKRIYRASLRGDEKAVHNLQRLLMKSEAARTPSVTTKRSNRSQPDGSGYQSLERVRRGH